MIKSLKRWLVSTCEFCSAHVQCMDTLLTSFAQECRGGSGRMKDGSKGRTVLPSDPH